MASCKWPASAVLFPNGFAEAMRAAIAPAK
jgi:hypothetical protein